MPGHLRSVHGLPGGGRGGRRVAVRQRAARRRRLELADPTVGLRRGGPGTGVGDCGAGAVLCGGVAYHRRRTVGRGGPWRLSLDGVAPPRHAGDVPAAGWGGCGLFTGVGGWVVVLDEFAEMTGEAWASELAGRAPLGARSRPRRPPTGFSPVAPELRPRCGGNRVLPGWRRSPASPASSTPAWAPPSGSSRRRAPSTAPVPHTTTIPPPGRRRLDGGLAARPRTGHPFRRRAGIGAARGRSLMRR